MCYQITKSPNYHSCLRGFTLIELSIVLVIIGLISGAVLAGRDLIRAAELRSIVTEYENYQSAFRIFQDKYSALPGDMSDATAFWGTATNCPGDDTTPSNDEKTCNGNGNGIIEYHYSAAVPSTELHRAWQHLSNAKLISGHYTGVQATSANIRTFSYENSPSSKFKNSIWTCVSYGHRPSTDLYWWEGNYNNQLGFRGTTASGFDSVKLSPADARNIDIKLDDGKPQYGKVRTMRKNLHPSCTTTNVEATTDYDLTSNVTDACQLLFLPFQYGVSIKDSQFCYPCEVSEIFIN